MRKRLAAAVWAVLLALGLQPSVPAATGDPAKEEEPATLEERMERDVRRIRNQIRNASMRLDNGIQGMDSEWQDGNRPPTPARLCCGANVRRLESTIDSLEKAVAELIECYRDREDSAGVSNAEAGGGDLVKLRVQIRDFDAAADSEAATAAIDALTSGYLHLDEHFGTFTACEPAKKKKKRGRGD